MQTSKPTTTLRGCVWLITLSNRLKSCIKGYSCCFSGFHGRGTTLHQNLSGTSSGVKGTLRQNSSAPQLLFPAHSSWGRRFLVSAAAAPAMRPAAPHEVAPALTRRCAPSPCTPREWSAQHIPHVCLLPSLLFALGRARARVHVDDITYHGITITCAMHSTSKTVLCTQRDAHAQS